MAVGPVEDPHALYRALMAGVDLVGVDAMLASLVARPAWEAKAACRDADPRLFFPGRGEPTEPAKAICATCPVIEECRAFAESYGCQTHGIWAGTSARSRRPQPTATDGAEPPHGTLYRYQRHRCRCPDCRAANAARNRSYRQTA